MFTPKQHALTKMWPGGWDDAWTADAPPWGWFHNDGCPKPTNSQWEKQTFLWAKTLETSIKLNLKSLRVFLFFFGHCLFRTVFLPFFISVEWREERKVLHFDERIPFGRLLYSIHFFLIGCLAVFKPTAQTGHGCVLQHAGEWSTPTFSIRKYIII